MPQDYYYLEIGTCDATYNNLASQYPDQLGISVEPIKEYLATLPDNNGLNIKVPVAISENDGTAEINKCTITATKTKKDGSGWKGRSTLLDLTSLGIRQQHRFEKQKIKTMTLETLIKKYQIATVQIMRVDTEGYDGIIITQLLQTSLRPEYLTYEHLHLDKQEKIDLRDKLSNEYQLIKTTYLDDYWKLN